jgi:hypothetical protein
MPGLVPGIYVFRSARKTWMAGTSPAMTAREISDHHPIRMARMSFTLVSAGPVRMRWDTVAAHWLAP